MPRIPVRIRNAAGQVADAKSYRWRASPELREADTQKESNRIESRTYQDK
jgi:hypothetical protein